MNRNNNEQSNMEESYHSRLDLVECEGETPQTALL